MVQYIRSPPLLNLWRGEQKGGGGHQSASLSRHVYMVHYLSDVVGGRKRRLKKRRWLAKRETQQHLREKKK